MTPVVPVAAATVVLLRPGRDGAEVLLTQRPASMAFGADLHVFPGGKVDPEDSASSSSDPARDALGAARSLGDNLAPGEALAVHHAALRELREETAVSLSGIGRLAPIAHWTTPRFMPRRFSTWFFVADLPPDVTLRFAPDEIAGHRWLTAPAALEQVASGEITMWVPTTSVLQRLLEIGAETAVDVARAVTFARELEPEVAIDEPARVEIRMHAAGATPGRTGVATLHGRHELVLVDPGDPSEAAIDAIEAAVTRRGGAIRAILLTATDPDHAAGAEALAIPLAIPILVAPGAGRHLPYVTIEAGDGDPLPADVDLRVRLGPAGSGRLEVVASAGE